LANLVVVDLEATCSESPTEISLEAMEIIEIGAVRLDGNLNATTDTFSCFVKPKQNPQLTPFCQQLTKIEQTHVDGANHFALAGAEFFQWLGEDAIILSWGDWDAEQLAKEARDNQLVSPISQSINLKREFYRVRKMREGGLRAAIDRAGLAFIGQPHRALSDALTTAQLAPLSGLSDYDPLWQKLMKISGKTALQLRPWLRAKHPLLNGQTPMHLMLNVAGRQKVANILAAIDQELGAISEHTDSATRR
jgi:inhibitor of KinA sporulation pathway (predicted exonuclease)